MSDERKATGVDYFQLGVSIASSINLGKIRRLQEEEIQKNALESEIRQFIFEIEGGLDKLIKETYLRSNSLGSAVAITMIQWMLKEIKFGPSMFEQFVDKDRTKNFLERLDLTRQICFNDLDQSEKESVEKYAYLSYKGVSLPKLIKHLKATEELKKTHQQWDKLSGPANSWAALAWISIVAGFIMFFVAAYDYDRGLWPVGWWLAIAAMVVVFIWSLVRHSKATKIAGYHTLRQERQRIEADTIQSYELDEIYKDIPKGLSLEEYEKMLVEINKFYDSLFHDTNGDKYQESLLFVVFPKKFVEEKLGHSVN